MTILQKRIDFLQNEVASKDAIIKMLVEMQAGILDSGTNCTSQDKDNITTINITDDSFIPVNNSKHNWNYDQNKKNREQNKEKTNSENTDQELSDKSQNGNQTAYANRDISEKKQLFIGNLHSDTTEEDLYKIFGLRSTQYLKQNDFVNMPLINKTGKSKEFAFIVTPEKVHQSLLKLDRIDLLGGKVLIKEAISTRKNNPKQNERPNFVVNNFPETQDLLKRPRIVPGNMLYVTAVSEGEVDTTYEERNYSRQPQRKKIFIICDSHLTRIKENSLRKKFKRHKVYFTGFSGANTKQLDHYVIPVLVDKKP